MIIINAIISAFIWIYCALITLTLYIVQLLLSLFLFWHPKRHGIMHRQCFWWGDAMTFFNPFWQVRVEGREHVRTDETYVIVANHQSLADIVILYETHLPFKWVAKESLFKIPVFGWCMSLCGYIRLRRGDAASIKEVYRWAGRELEKGTSVLFFPEGTRSESKEMNPFQNGAFKLALKKKVSILPIAVRGTIDAIPKGNWIFNRKAYCHIRILKPISTSERKVADFEDLKAEVRSKIEEVLRED